MKNGESLSRLFSVSVVFALGFATFFGGCQTEIRVVYLDVQRDAGPEVIMPRSCRLAVECDDGISCTEDLCESSLCVHRTKDDLCNDGVFCNGVETCSETAGCVSAEAGPCEDFQACTLDLCDESTRMCSQAPRDVDGDQDADMACGGNDCDDRDPRVASNLAERCNDGLDNNCNQQVDEEPCTLLEGDRCGNPILVPGAGSFTVSMGAAFPDVTLACSQGTSRDVVFSFAIDRPQSVRLRALSSSGIPSMELRAACDQQAEFGQCSRGLKPSLGLRSLPAGTYYVWLSVAGSLNTSLTGTLQLEFDEPVQAEDDGCAAAVAMEWLPNQSSGQMVATANFDLLAGNTAVLGSPQSECSMRAGADSSVVYRSFHLDETSDIRIAASAASDRPLALGLIGECEAPNLRCFLATPVSERQRSLPPGNYRVAIAGSRVDRGELRLERSAPTQAPLGDLCAQPTPLSFAAAEVFDLRDFENDREASCSAATRERFFSFVLDQPSDLEIALTSENGGFAISLVGGCTDESLCIRMNEDQRRISGLSAGTHIISVEGPPTASFEIELTQAAYTATTTVSGNNGCASAFQVPEGGGVFVGTTAASGNSSGSRTCGALARSPDQAFVLNLAQRSRVTATLESEAFDPVLVLFSEGPEALCSPNDEIRCDDDSGPSNSAAFSPELDAGRYFLVVDGWGNGPGGAYRLRVDVTQLP